VRSVVYYVAATVDGYIARPDGSFDDFPMDEEYLGALLAEYPETFPGHVRPAGATREDNRHFDAVLMGRTTYEVGLRVGVSSPYPTLDQYLFSTTMTASPDPAVTLVRDSVVDAVSHLKRGPGKSIWLCGGAQLAATLFAARAGGRNGAEDESRDVRIGDPSHGPGVRPDEATTEGHRRAPERSRPSPLRSAD
jgi:dihydrofolate reductase